MDIGSGQPDISQRFLLVQQTFICQRHTRRPFRFPTILVCTIVECLGAICTSRHPLPKFHNTIQQCRLYSYTHDRRHLSLRVMQVHFLLLLYSTRSSAPIVFQRSKLCRWFGVSCRHHLVADICFRANRVSHDNGTQHVQIVKHCWCTLSFVLVCVRRQS